MPTNSDLLITKMSWEETDEIVVAYPTEQAAPVFFDKETSE